MSDPKFASSLSSPDTSTLPAISASKFTKPPSSPPHKKQKKQSRGKSQVSGENFWKSQYMHLNELVTPEDNRTRNNPQYRHLFFRESKRKKNSFTRDPVQCASERDRFQHISAVSIRRAYDRAQGLRERKVARKAREELYKVAYIKFKKARFEKFERMGVYQTAREKGWSATKEWRHWQGMVNMYKHLGWGRSKGMKYVMDDFQRKAERGIFDITARKPEREDK
jgi:hypothetical protein